MTALAIKEKAARQLGTMLLANTLHAAPLWFSPVNAVIPKRSEGTACQLNNVVIPLHRVRDPLKEEGI